MVEPGQTLSHHKLIRLIGKGGMGEVYVARDTRLGREVALKVLPQELADDPETLQRFRREARAVAALNHPHIVTIHSVEEHDGRPFFTMELVDGLTLDRLVQPGGLPVDEVLEIGIALADALTAAHDKGIIHRDLKPANIMRTESGQVKVLDFGLAKLAEESAALAATDTGRLAEADLPLTGTGAVLGTVPYMSPEQLQGKPADPRSDIFGLGAVLYQVATGQRPFKGHNSAELVSAIMRDTPASVTDLRQDVPRHLSRILRHMLAKQPDERFQTARDVGNELRDLQRELLAGEVALQEEPHSERTSSRSGAPASLPAQPAPRPSRVSAWWLIPVALAASALTVFGLRWLGPGPSATEGVPQNPAPAALAVTQVASVAVLPFASLSGQAEDDYFAEGLSEELRSVLTQINGLQVAARTSSSMFRERQVDVAEIGRQLGVAHLLEGSVRKSGSSLRISTRLIKVRDGFPLWSENYDRRLADVLQVQEDVARSVVAALKGPLLGMDQGALRARATNAEAFDLYLRGRHSAGRRTPEGFSNAIGSFREAITLDADYALAWAGLARAYANQAAFGFVDTREGLAKAREAAQRSISLDSSLPDAHATMAWLLMVADWDWSAADAAIHKALTLDPGNVNVINSSATLARTLGRFDEGIALARRITELDPLAVTARANYGLHLAYAGHHQEALGTFRKVLELQPEYPAMQMHMGRVYLTQGEVEKALEAMEAETHSFYRSFGLALSYHAAGREEEARQVLDQFIQEHRDHSAYQVAEIYAYRGDVEEAFRWLNIAFDQHDGGLQEIKGNPLLRPLHQDPRWPQFMTMMNLPL